MASKWYLYIFLINWKNFGGLIQKLARNLKASRSVIDLPQVGRFLYATMALFWCSRLKTLVYMEVGSTSGICANIVNRGTGYESCRLQLRQQRSFNLC